MNRPFSRAGDRPGVNTRRPLAVAIALLGLFAGAVAALGQALPVLLNRRPSELGVLMAVVPALSLVASPVGVFLVGYWGGTETDLAEEYLSFALVLGVAGGAGLLVGYAATTLVALGPELGHRPLLVATTSGYSVGIRALDFAVTGLAGGAVGYFRRGPAATAS